jgi:cell division protein FtsI (penicillin-binding protein 3)
MQKFPQSKIKFRSLPKAELKGRQRKNLKDNETNETNSAPPKRTTTNLKLRLFAVWGVLIAGGIGLGVNLYNLQIVRGSKLTQKARSQQMVNLRPYMPRRQIIDRNKNVLAIDRQVYSLYAHPKQFNKPRHQVAEELAKILDQDTSKLESRFASQNSGILLNSALAEGLADRVVALRFDGLELRQKYARYYPTTDLASEVVGYVNLDRRGQAGVEYSQEKLLERSVQTVRLSRAGNGALMPDYAPEGFPNFDDMGMQLTIDSRLQQAARFALKNQMKRYSAKRGAVIVMDAYDGSLLAMVTQPTYNPNEYSKADISLFRNWTVADLYEPGSTFKPLNVAIGLEAGIIKPDDTFRDSGIIQVGDRIIKNSEDKRYGRINISQILKYSSNIGMVQIIQRMRPSAYYGWLEKLGLGQGMETDLPFSVASQLKSQEEFINTPIEPATTSFGQGFSLTPLQLVQMTGALANGGKLVTPHVVKGLFDSKGQMHYTPTRPEPRQIFSPITTQKVVEMMETVVSTKGTGKEAQISGYRLAGKTGTAQKASASGGYISGARITSFIGILPVESPRYVVLALVDEPKGEHAYGGTVAAPIARKVMEALINTEQIPPSPAR